MIESIGIFVHRTADFRYNKENYIILGHKLKALNFPFLIPNQLYIYIYIYIYIYTLSVCDVSPTE